MFEKLSAFTTEKKSRDLAMVAGGRLGLTAGGKVVPLALFTKGLAGLEDAWRRDHPEFEGGLAERWSASIAFYEATHRDPTNRLLHTVGIPMILGGALGMLAAPRYTPPWWLANGSWTCGWVLNFIGHGVFEKAAPAFSDDPLSFVAGPAWDFVRLRERVAGGAAAASAPMEGPAPTAGPEPATA